MEPPIIKYQLDSSVLTGTLSCLRKYEKYSLHASACRVCHSKIQLKTFSNGNQQLYLVASSSDINTN